MRSVISFVISLHLILQILKISLKNIKTQNKMQSELNTYILCIGRKCDRIDWSCGTFFGVWSMWIGDVYINLLLVDINQRTSTTTSRPRRNGEQPRQQHQAQPNSCQQPRTTTTSSAAAAAAAGLQPPAPAPSKTT